MDIKLFNMGFGESILLSSYEDNSCFLIDCGSESPSKDAYFQNVINEITSYSSKSALLTHFHEDHINGFLDISKKDPHSFDMVYIPHIFTLDHPNFTDLEIIRYILERIQCPNDRRFTLWDLLKQLVTSRQRIELLRRGDFFNQIESEFNVLWPIADQMMPHKITNSITKKLKISEEDWNAIYRLSDAINKMYLELYRSRGDVVFERNINSVESELRSTEEKLYILWLQQIQVNNEFRSGIEQCIQSIKRNANKASIVFQGGDVDKRILLTGDIPSNIMDKIGRNEFSPSIRLHEKYYAVKAPHHGTDTHYFNFGCYAVYDVVMVSNGETRMPKRGLVSHQYNQLSRSYAIKCTNSCSGRCDCYKCLPRIKCSQPNDMCGIVNPQPYIVIQ